MSLGPISPAFNTKTERSIVFTENHFIFGMKDRTTYIRVCKIQHNPSILISWCMGTYKMGNVFSSTIDISGQHMFISGDMMIVGVTKAAYFSKLNVITGT